jgi:hypothetical protein
MEGLVAPAATQMLPVSMSACRWYEAFAGQPARLRFGGRSFQDDEPQPV